MNKITRLGMLTLALGSLALSQSTHAAGLLGQVKLEAGANLDAKVVQATTSADVNADANVSPSAVMRASGTGSAAASGDVSGSATSASQIGGQITTGGNASATMGTSTNNKTFTITRGDLGNESTTTVRDPLEVTTAGDFESYAKTVMLSDENITRIDSDSDMVSVWYKAPAKFIGILPVTVPTRATVYADGRVEIDHPWWIAIFVKDESPTANIETDLNATAGTIARSTGSTTLSTNTQARLVNALRAVLQAEIGTSTSSTASASSSATTY